jgi:ribosomal protein S18 acetylase RimI-like enzyme
VHADALKSGMALGALDSLGHGVLERSYRDVVAALGNRDRLLLVAEENEEILGMAQLVFSGATNADHRAEVQRVGVATAARGRGIGRLLMTAVEEAAGERGVTLLWLTTHADTEACGFYEAVGYTRMGTMPNYSRRPDGTLWPGAFYFKELAA